MSIEVNAYGTHYSHFTSALYNSVRADTHLDDFGQNGWMTPEEHDLLISWLELSQERILLDVACGSGGPTLRIAERTGCSVEAIDIQESGILAARARANELGLADRVNFHALDAGCLLPFDAGSFDSVICNDAINHLGDRKQVLAEWARVTRKGGLIGPPRDIWTPG